MVSLTIGAIEKSTNSYRSVFLFVHIHEFINELTDNAQYLVNQLRSSSQLPFFPPLSVISTSLHGHPLPSLLLTCSSSPTCINKCNFWILLLMIGGGGLLTASGLIRSSARTSNYSLEETHRITALRGELLPSLFKTGLHRWHLISYHFSATSSSSAATWESSWQCA